MQRGAIAGQYMSETGRGCRIWGVRGDDVTPTPTLPSIGCQKLVSGRWRSGTLGSGEFEVFGATVNYLNLQNRASIAFLPRKTLS